MRAEDLVAIVAYHEAAHCVIAAVLGIKTEKITLTRTTRRAADGGLESTFLGLTRFAQDSDPSPLARAMALPDRLFRHAIATAAGPASEARFCRSTGLQPEDAADACAHDFRYVRKVAAKTGIDVDEAVTSSTARQPS